MMFANRSVSRLLNTPHSFRVISLASRTGSAIPLSFTTSRRLFFSDAAGKSSGEGLKQQQHACPIKEELEKQQQQQQSQPLKIEEPAVSSQEKSAAAGLDIEKVPFYAKLLAGVTAGASIVAAVSAIGLIGLPALNISPFLGPSNEFANIHQLKSGTRFVMFNTNLVQHTMTAFGAVHLGLAFAKYKRDGSAVKALSQFGRIVFGTLPIASAVLIPTMVPPVYALPAILAVLNIQFFGDMWADWMKLLPSWYMKMKTPWTIASLLSIGLLFIVLNQDFSSAQERK